MMATKKCAVKPKRERPTVAKIKELQDQVHDAYAVLHAERRVSAEHAAETREWRGKYSDVFTQLETHKVRLREADEVGRLRLETVDKLRQEIKGLDAYNATLAAKVAEEEKAHALTIDALAAKASLAAALQLELDSRLTREAADKLHQEAADCAAQREDTMNTLDAARRELTACERVLGQQNATIKAGYERDKWLTTRIDTLVRESTQHRREHQDKLDKAYNDLGAAHHDLDMLTEGIEDERRSLSVWRGFAGLFLFLLACVVVFGYPWKGLL